MTAWKRVAPLMPLLWKRDPDSVTAWLVNAIWKGLIEQLEVRVSTLEDEVGRLVRERHRDKEKENLARLFAEEKRP